MARSSETTVGGTRENSPWSLFGSLFGHSRVWIGLSSLVFISLVVYFWLNFTETKVGNQQYILALIIPLVLAYIHPYDLVLSSIIVAISFISGTKRTGATVLLFLFLLPTLSTNLSSVFAAFSIYFVCWLGATSRTNYWRKDLLELISASIIYISVVIVTEDVGLRVNLHMTILIVGSLLFIFAELLRTPAQKRLNGI